MDTQKLDEFLTLVRDGFLLIDPKMRPVVLVSMIAELVVNSTGTPLEAFEELLSHIRKQITATAQVNIAALHVHSDVPDAEGIAAAIRENLNA